MSGNNTVVIFCLILFFFFFFFFFFIFFFSSRRFKTFIVCSINFAICFGKTFIRYIKLYLEIVKTCNKSIEFCLKCFHARDLIVMTACVLVYEDFRITERVMLLAEIISNSKNNPKAKYSPNKKHLHCNV